VRVCSEAYTPPHQEATGTRCSKHLTNYSAQRYEPGFEHNADPNEACRGTKRSLAPVIAHLEATYGVSAANGIWAQISCLCAKTLTAMAVQLNHGAADAEGLEPTDLWSPSRDGASLWDNVQTRWDDPSWGDWRSKCFHLLGIDVILSAPDEGTPAPKLLEVNCNPSLGIDAVHVVEGPYASELDPPVPGTEALIDAAMPLMKGRGVKVCRCRSHHRPHLHRPCAIDMTAKRACVGGALTIVERDMKAHKEGGAIPPPSALCEGTRYEALTPEDGSAIGGSEVKSQAAHDGIQSDAENTADCEGAKPIEHDEHVAPSLHGNDNEIQAAPLLS
jgi:hypothetical protein